MFCQERLAEPGAGRCSAFLFFFFFLSLFDFKKNKSNIYDDKGCRRLPSNPPVHIFLIFLLIITPQTPPSMLYSTCHSTFFPPLLLSFPLSSLSIPPTPPFLDGAPLKDGDKQQEGVNVNKSKMIPRRMSQVFEGGGGGAGG